MQDIVIVGAGGLGKDIQWVLERINSRGAVWNIAGYIDDAIAPGTLVDDRPILGTVDWLAGCDRETAVVCAVANAKTRRRIIRKLEQNKRLTFPNIIDPSVVMSGRVAMGRGNVMLAGNIVSVDIRIGDFCIINAACTVGHDDILHSYVTLYPGVNVSGCVEICEETEIGTGSHIIQGLRINSGVIAGAGAVIIHELPPECTAVGNPAKPVKYHTEDARKQ